MDLWASFIYVKYHDYVFMLHDGYLMDGFLFPSTMPDIFGILYMLIREILLHIISIRLCTSLPFIGWIFIDYGFTLLRAYGWRLQYIDNIFRHAFDYTVNYHTPRRAAHYITMQEDL